MARPVKHYNKWRIRWTDETGKRRSEVHDTYQDALLRLRQHQARVQEVRRGLRSPEPPRRTFEDLATYWLENRSIHKRSKKDDQCIIRSLRSFFGPTPLQDIGVEKGDAYQKWVQHNSISGKPLDKKTVANHLTLLISMLRLAVDLGWIRKAPKIRKPKVPLISKDFRYLRTQEEITSFLDAARAEGDMIFTLYATAVYTGMRAGELAGLRWDDVDFVNRVITVQRSFDTPTKTESIRHVPILDPLLPVLREWRLKQPNALVFPNQRGAMLGKSARAFQEVLHRVLDRAEFPKTQRNGRTIRYITFHSIRHTFASHWVLHCGDLFRLQKILGHSDIRMTQRYSHLAPDAYTGGYARLGDKTTLLPAEVVDFSETANP
jgi:integrase